ncbi:MAG: RluA family pseudouridine synthase [Bacteroidetes bacterium]|nr:RluA family pseudouridine synthase [Bacteroidota bacterium]
MSRHLQQFNKKISEIKLPEKFTFPFYYEPHALTEIATQELQQYLETQSDFSHNFGLKDGQSGKPIGKMFGVLVVQKPNKELGYLAAFSGKLADKSLPNKFVPPVYNVHAKDSFFAKGEKELNAINKQIADLEDHPRFLVLQLLVEAKSRFVSEEIRKGKEQLKATKKERKNRREEAEQTLSPDAFEALQEKLKDESLKGQFLYKQVVKEIKKDLQEYQEELETFTSKIKALKQKRKRKSKNLQRQIFENYAFFNQQKEIKRLTDIFPNFEEQQPPSGAGDCTAPKLLQYAFQHDLKPISMGEFWWGISPSTEIRKHKHYYPACRGRCKPILGHMLKGLDMDENPFLKNPAADKKIPIVFEDDAFLIVNKPPEFLSVPGKQIKDSVYTRMKATLPFATGPLIVHRLDMSTSGILIIAKTKESHKALQSQFISKTVKKRYVALLDGEVEGDEGYIDLPLRVDLDDRPRQLVCYEHGKQAKTRWKVVERKAGKTRVHLYPITGRTHQLRVHMSHPKGLNIPISGDDLYGVKSNRLHLHAEHIEFQHPSTKEKVQFTVKADF